MIRTFLIATIASLLLGCTTPAKVVTASNTVAENAKNFRVKNEKAKIYFVNGKLVGNIFGVNHKYPSDFYINSQLIGSMNHTDAMVFEIDPGNYTFSWNVRSTDPIDKKCEPQPFEMRVAAGDVLVLRGDYDLAGASSFGLIGSLISPPKSELKRDSRKAVEGKQFVEPQQCGTLCSSN